MLNLAETIFNYVRETRKLETLPSSTETSFYPDLKVLLSAVLKSERLPFDVITGTSERGDMPDFVLGDSSLFVGVYDLPESFDAPDGQPDMSDCFSGNAHSRSICERLLRAVKAIQARDGMTPGRGPLDARRRAVRPRRTSARSNQILDPSVSLFPGKRSRAARPKAPTTPAMRRPHGFRGQKADWGNCGENERAPCSAAYYGR